MSRPHKHHPVGPQVQSQTAPPNAASRQHVLAGLTSFWAGLQTASQAFAHTFDYQAALGAHWGPLYAPWSIVLWVSQWHAQYPQEIMRSTSLGAVVTVIGLMGVSMAKVVASNTARASIHLHGSARWAQRTDIEAAGLLPREAASWAARWWSPFRALLGCDVSAQTGSMGISEAVDSVYVGGWQDRRGRFHYLRHSGPEHVLTYAPTRSGKGVGLVIPTLLSWSASAVITDLKGELWALTAGWRQRHAHNRVLRFEPAQPAGGVRWNPLDEIRLGSAHEVGDVQNLANSIVDPDGKGLDSHWQKTAFALLVGVMLHALYRARQEGRTANLSMIDAMMSDPQRDSQELWLEMSTWRHLPSGANHPAVGAAARDMMDRPEEEAGSVLSTAKSYLSLYRDPVVAANVASSDFAIRDLMHHDDPVSLYIVTQPSDKARLRPLVRVLLNMTVRLLADKMEFKDGRPVAYYKHRLLLMLDEFPSLGKLPILQESLAFVAGYGIKCYLICQDISQLKSREQGYGADESITSNCHVQNAYPPNRLETAEHLSRLSGQATVVKEQITTSGKRTSSMLSQVVDSGNKLSRIPNQN